MGPGDAGPVEQDNAIKRSVKVINKKDLERFLLRHYYVTLISAAKATNLTMSTAEASAFDLYLQTEKGLKAEKLMANAGIALAKYIQRCARENRYQNILALAGPGNNGGDAWVAARYLQENDSFSVTVWAPLGTPEGTASPAATAAQAAIKAGVAVNKDQFPASWDFAIDGLFGLGLSRPLEGIAAEAVTHLNQSSTPILSADVPSGLNSDTGKVMGVAIAAQSTIAFVGPRPGFFEADGPAHVGEVWVHDLGVDSSIALSWLEKRRG